MGKLYEALSRYRQEQLETQEEKLADCGPVEHSMADCEDSREAARRKSEIRDLDGGADILSMPLVAHSPKPLRLPGKGKRGAGNAKKTGRHSTDGVPKRHTAESALFTLDETSKWPETTGTQNYDPRLVTISRPDSFESECFKILRSRILYPADGQRPRSILVTSAAPGEGKSFAASNLAIAIAQNINEHVLLVDCDLRKPKLHEMFALGHRLGLSEHLSKGVPLPNVIRKTGIKKLSLITGGQTPNNPSEILCSSDMEELIAKLVGPYDGRTVVLDSPPPALAAETSVLARRVDGVLIVLECGKTPRKLVGEMIDLIGRDKILGCILNKTPASGSRYGASQYYARYKKKNRR